ncbi:unnamed protein product [Prorocentrum cordatum]|uniref:Uncharacterized protein n=1 Tax=Prorocentrum cordatum TaxID=2364126 RepID=A0ABN9XA29_9DINO|nr:unnamed protein product [Polarella glacialis]
MLRLGLIPEPCFLFGSFPVAGFLAPRRLGNWQACVAAEKFLPLPLRLRLFLPLCLLLLLLLLPVRRHGGQQKRWSDDITDFLQMVLLGSTPGTWLQSAASSKSRADLESDVLEFTCL